MRHFSPLILASTEMKLTKVRGRWSLHAPLFAVIPMEQQGPPNERAGVIFPIVNSAILLLDLLDSLKISSQRSICISKWIGDLLRLLVNRGEKGNGCLCCHSIHWQQEESGNVNVILSHCCVMYLWYKGHTFSEELTFSFERFFRSKQEIVLDRLLHRDLNSQVRPHSALPSPLHFPRRLRESVGLSCHRFLTYT